MLNLSQNIILNSIRVFFRTNFQFDLQVYSLNTKKINLHIVLNFTFPVKFLFLEALALCH